MRTMYILLSMLVGLTGLSFAKPKLKTRVVIVPQPEPRILKKGDKADCLLGRIVLSDGQTVYAVRFQFQDDKSSQAEVECADHIRFKSEKCPRNKIVSIEFPGHGLDLSHDVKAPPEEFFFFPPDVIVTQTVKVRFICIDPPADDCGGEYQVAFVTR